VKDFVKHCVIFVELYVTTPGYTEFHKDHTENDCSNKNIQYSMLNFQYSRELKIIRIIFMTKFFISIIVALAFAPCAISQKHTTISIKGQQFYINGEITYKGRSWQGNKLKGCFLIPEWYREFLMMQIRKQKFYLNTLIQNPGMPTETPMNLLPK
jgi:hypothetical protein